MTQMLTLHGFIKLCCLLSLFYLMQQSFLIVPVQDLTESKFHISPCSLHFLSVFQTRPIFTKKDEEIKAMLPEFPK